MRHRDAPINKEDKMQQLIILIVALALAGGVYLFLTISKKKSKEQTEENAVEMMTANE